MEILTEEEKKYIQNISEVIFSTKLVAKGGPELKAKLESIAKKVLPPSAQAKLSAQIDVMQTKVKDQYDLVGEFESTETEIKAHYVMGRALKIAGAIAENDMEQALKFYKSKEAEVRFTLTEMKLMAEYIVGLDKESKMEELHSKIYNDLLSYAEDESQRQELIEWFRGVHKEKKQERNSAKIGDMSVADLLGAKPEKGKASKANQQG